MANKGYPSDSSDAEWAFAASYLTLITQDALQRKHDLRRVYDALKYVTRTGIPWRFLPADFPPGLPSTSKRDAGSRQACSKP